MKTNQMNIERKQTIKFHIYNEGMESVRPENPYTVRTCLNMGDLTDRAFGAFKEALESLEGVDVTAEDIRKKYRIELGVGQSLYTSAEEALEILATMDQQNEEILMKHGLSAEEARSFAQTAQRLIEGSSQL